MATGRSFRESVLPHPHFRVLTESDHPSRLHLYLVGLPV